jgi:Xaa-Pro aminopeptidase
MLSQSDFKARRQKVFAQMQDNSIAILSAASMQHRNSDTEFPYRQESHFLYLTGFEESIAIAALVKKGSEQHLFYFAKNEIRKLSNGQVAGQALKAP